MVTTSSQEPILGRDSRKTDTPKTMTEMGSWLDVVTIYISPFGAVLCAVVIYFLLGIEPLREELNRGRLKPLGRSFPVIGYFYVLVSAVVVICGIAMGGIG